MTSVNEPRENLQSAYAKTKTQISFAVTAKLISAFVFATRIVQFLLYLTPKFQASSSFLCLYRPVCVGPVRKPHCWFSHEAAQILWLCMTTKGLSLSNQLSGIRFAENHNHAQSYKDVFFFHNWCARCFNLNKIKSIFLQ